MVQGFQKCLMKNNCILHLFIMNIFDRVMTFLNLIISTSWAPFEYFSPYHFHFHYLLHLKIPQFNQIITLTNIPNPHNFPFSSMYPIFYNQIYTISLLFPHLSFHLIPNHFLLAENWLIFIFILKTDESLLFLFKAFLKLFCKT